MKSIQIKSILFFVTVILASSCNDPKTTDCVYIDKRLCEPGFDNSILEGVVDFDPSKLNNYDQKTLLEEFTGFKCTNCPTATATAKNLRDKYPGRLHLVAIHCTEEFASPNTDDPNEPFYIDFRTPEGETLHDFFDPPGLPDGVIDRLGTESTSTIPFPLWADELESLMVENNPECYLEILAVDVNEDSTSIELSAIAKPLISSEDDINLNVVVLESGIEEAQKTSGNETIYDYIHDHVFRTASHGPWGIKGFDGDLEVESDKILSFKFNIDLQEDWVIENLEIVFYASRESNREVIQSEYFSF